MELFVLILVVGAIALGGIIYWRSKSESVDLTAGPNTVTKVTVPDKNLPELNRKEENLIESVMQQAKSSDISLNTRKEQPLYAIVARDADDDPVIIEDYKPSQDGKLSVMTSLPGDLSAQITDTGDTMLFVGDKNIAILHGVPFFEADTIHFQRIENEADFGEPDKDAVLSEDQIAGNGAAKMMVIDDFDPEAEKLELDAENDHITWTAVDRADGSGANLIYAGRVVAILKGVAASQLSQRNVMIA